MSNYPTVKIEVLDGVIEFVLDNNTPNSIDAFIYFANAGVLDGRAITRVVPDFVIQPVYDEESEIEAYSELVHGEFTSCDGKDHNYIKQYDLCLAGDGQTVSSPACYFIVLSEDAADKLDGSYTSIGSLVSGAEILQRIENTDTMPIDIGVPNVFVNRPTEDIVIEEVKIELNGYKPKLPIFVKY